MRSIEQTRSPERLYTARRDPVRGEGGIQRETIPLPAQEGQACIYGEKSSKLGPFLDAFVRHAATDAGLVRHQKRRAWLSSYNQG